MPAVEAWAIEPLWVQFEALLPPHPETHPWGCHNPRIPDRIVFDKLVAKLVFGGSYERHADQSCSATTMRTRRNEWIAAGVFARLEQIVLETYDRVVGLDLADITVDGQITKAPCGGEVAGKSPIDRGKLGIKWSRMTDGRGIPLGCAVTGANRHDSPFLRPTLEKLGRFELALPEQITVHLDAGYDSTVTRKLLTELGCEWRIQPKGVGIPINHTRRWVVERTNSWYSRGFNFTLSCTERRAVVINSLLALMTAIIVIRRLIREAWTSQRWPARPARRP
ncbi:MULTISPECIES: IS5 family transposase [unclassified Streptomyces]|uniref:IS5 family transposase n=1 Tax=unclassified Streptomyces TaxID=2593676 RepID=UPI002253AF42|nr:MULTISPECIES: IS5 family transposase [unclassified Streptomyces]MCX5103713.1 IS5 family transposase [Streptomyces sp. NBC_00439]WSC32123.1 IS5 family transposase [Streptomyces sp. NBC_01768]WSX06162.1 IS5 family transposase [Streptomyces sp. NBC_00987]